MIETNLLKIKRLASIREDENYRFRTFLKGKDDKIIDRIVQRLHLEIIRQIDCSLCGNCCCVLKPRLHPEDIIILARMENMTPKSYQDNFCEKSELDEIFLKTIPCRYLEEKRCSIFKNRPEECKSYPNTQKEGFTGRLLAMINAYEVCPIVFNLMERLKNETHFKR